MDDGNSNDGSETQKATTAAAGRQIVTFNTYQRAAAVTHRTDRSDRFHLGNYALGVAGEAGEVADLMKKHLYHEQPLDEDALRKELGDVLWYVTSLCTVMGWALADVATLNIEKLRARHNGGGFTPAYHARPFAAPATEDGR